MNACHEPGEVPALDPGDTHHHHLDHWRRLGLALLLGWSALVGSGCTPETEHPEPAPDLGRAWLHVGDRQWGGTRRFMERPSLTFDAEGAPVVAWSEKLTVLVNRIFVRRWDGSAWQELGPSIPEMSTESGSIDGIALERGPAGQLWLRWWTRDPQGDITTHLATWDGAAWQHVWSSPVGEWSLRRLRVGPSNQPVGLFGGRVKRFRDGHWEDLGSPPVPPGGGAAETYSLAGLMVDAQDRPLLAEATAATVEMPGGAMRLSRWDSGAWQVLGELPTSLLDRETRRPPVLTTLGMEADPLGRPLLAWTETQSFCVRTCRYYYKTHVDRWDGVWASAAPPLDESPSGFAVEPSGALLIGNMGQAVDRPEIKDYFVRRADGGPWESIGSVRESSDSPTIDNYAGGDLAVRPNGVPCVAYVEVSQEGEAVRVACHNR